VDDHLGVGVVEKIEPACSSSLRISRA